MGKRDADGLNELASDCDLGLIFNVGNGKIKINRGKKKMSGNLCNNPPLRVHTQAIKLVLVTEEFPFAVKNLQAVE